MVFARILRPSSHGAKQKSVDVSGAEKMEGVQVVRDGNFIAVLDENRDKANEAIVKINAEYTFNKLKVNDKTLFDWMPEMECVILDRKDKAPKGGGEPMIIVIGAIIANAIFDATGARLYRMPMTPERVQDAIKKV